MESLSLETHLQARMRKLEIGHDFAGKLSGIPGARLSRAFRGLERIQREQLLRLAKVMDDLELLVQAAAPLPLRLDNPEKIRPILETLRSHPKEIETISERFQETQSNDAAHQ
jgi:hypothetical protein